MQLIPAIDILDGKVVRLKQGDYDRVTVWSEEPVKLALQYEQQGATRLHLVNLDGARNPHDQSAFLALVQELAARTSLQIQTGGGVRTLQDIQCLLDSGVSKVVVGTLLFSGTETVASSVQLFGSHRMVGALDVRKGQIQVEAWVRNTGISVRQALQQAAGTGLEEVLMTGIESDGLRKGPHLALYRTALRHSRGLRLIASGGVSSLEDLSRLQRLGCHAAVVGRALLSAEVSLAEWSPSSDDASQDGEKRGADLAVRIIPCLDVDRGRVVKGTSFRNLRDAGDPVELARRYCAEGADELVFLDITATSDRRETACELAREVARAVNIPFTVGGGVRSVRDGRALLDAGADKVSMNTAALARPGLLSEMAELLGRANTVCAIDVRRRPGGWTALVEGGRRDTGRDALQWAEEAEQRGAGEILLTSFDRDGTSLGFDVELLHEVKRRVSIPVIASGGAGTLECFVEAVRVGHADALLAASVFHFGTYSIREVKQAIKEASIGVRL